MTTYTHPDVFTLGVTEGWADAETDPARIDWPARQAAAAIAFRVVDGRPVNPGASTGIRYGRNELGLWGENLMADALVTITCGHYRYLLMVERGDGYGWAVPGGSAEAGETAVQAALRELAEETGLTIGPEEARAGEPLYVPDPRASDEAWAVTVPVTADLGGSLLGLPYVKGGDDARRAEWIRAGCYEDLEATLRQVHGGRVFPAHEAMLRRFLADGGAVTGPEPEKATETHRGAVELAQFYFRRIAEAAGANWDSDNDTEIELMVSFIIDAARAGQPGDLAAAEKRIRELENRMSDAFALLRGLDRLRPTCVICTDATANRQTSRGPACTDCAGDLPDDGTDPDRPETWSFGEAPLIAYPDHEEPS